MDEGKYRLRDFEQGDYAAAARLQNRVDPTDPTTPEELQHWKELTHRAPYVDREFVVEDRGSGSVVASGGIEQSPFNYDPQRFWLSVQVDPDHRRRGIGQFLYDRSEREAMERGAVGLWSSARAEDPASVRFQQRQGFVELRRVWVSRLDLARADLSGLADRSAALAAEGIRVSTLAAEDPNRPDVRERAFRLWDSSAQDVPVVGRHTSPSFDEFVRLEFESPDFCPDAVFVAIHGDEYVGLTSNSITPVEPDTLRIGYTGVLKEYRGRGIATELKRRAIEYARTRGLRTVRTGNDSLNAPIWAINQRLGFVRAKTWINAEKLLTPSE
jgi:mycothiol synthase